MTGPDYSKQSGYNSRYDNDQGHREDYSIAKLIEAIVRDGDNVIDVGCGNLYGKKLIDSRKIKLNVYLGIDPGDWPDMKPAGEVLVINGNVEDYIHAVTEDDVVLLLFSANYISPIVLYKLMKAKWVLMVHYDRPYLPGSISYYAGDKWGFWKTHWFGWLMIRVVIFALRNRAVIDTNLLNQSYYRATVIKGRKARL